MALFRAYKRTIRTIFRAGRVFSEVEQLSTLIGHDLTHWNHR